jgi:Sugar phosphate permease
MEQGFLDPIVGFLVDRLGSRKLMLFGWGVMGLGFLLMSRINSLWAFYGSFALISAGFAFGSFVVLNAAAANWFTRKRSRAMTIIAAGFGPSGALVPLVALLVGQLGWRKGLVIIAIGLWIIGFPLCLVMRHKPSQYGLLPDGDTAADIRSVDDIRRQESRSAAVDFTVKTALKTRAFWLITLALFFQHIPMSAVQLHIVPYLESVNIPTTTAATVVMGMTLCSLIGRVGFGFLGDFKTKRYLMAIAISLQVIGLLAFAYVAIDKAWLIILFLLLYGPGFGGAIPLRPAMLADYFGTRNFGTIFGCLAFLSMLGGMASPVIAGWVFDTTGSYASIWRLFALLIIPAIPLILIAKPPRAKQEPQEGTQVKGWS